MNHLLKNDIPALRLSDGKLWWKEKTYKAFAKQSCGLSNSEYTLIIIDFLFVMKLYIIFELVSRTWEIKYLQ